MALNRCYPRDPQTTRSVGAGAILVIPRLWDWSQVTQPGKTESGLCLSVTAEWSPALPWGSSRPTAADMGGGVGQGGAGQGAEGRDCEGRLHLRSQARNGHSTPFMCIVWHASGASLVVWWLRLCTPTAGRAGLILVWGTKILHAAWHGQNKKEYFSWEFVITKIATPSGSKIAYWRSCHVVAQNQNSCVIFLNECLQNKNHRSDGLELQCL